MISTPTLKYPAQSVSTTENELPPVRTGEQQYQHDASEYGLALSHEEEEDLIERARSGDMEARSDISLCFLPHCSRLASRLAYAYCWALPRVEYQDLAQLGNEIVLNILDRALERQNPFAYLYKYVRCEMIKYCVAGYRYTPIQVTSLDKHLRTDEGDSTLIDILAGTLMALSPVNQDDHPLLNKFIDALPPRQREMVLRHHGLRDYAPESFRTIARICNMSGSSAFISYNRGLEKLRLSMEVV